MSDEERIIPHGPFKGKRIEMAPAGGVELFQRIADDFMLRIFGFEPGDYLITDESSLWDFTGDMSLADIHKKVQREYHLDVSGLKSENLLEIFVLLHERQSEAE